MFGLDTIPDAMLRGAVLATISLLWIILSVRVVGLRSFSKMTSFDFVTTLGVGSLLATAATKSQWPGFLQAQAAILTLLVVQMLLATGRRRSRRFQLFLENDPTLLFHDGRFLHGALRRTRVSESDVLSKIRGAGLTDLSQVRAVVLESTGDIAIIAGDHAPADELMRWVDQYDKARG